MQKDLTFTHIEEAARKQFGISRDEYALCNYIQTWASHPAARMPGYCDRTRGQMADFIGIGERGIQKMLPRLTNLGLIERSAAYHYRITRRWFDAVVLAERERKGEQSSPRGRTKFTPTPEQSSPIPLNKVHPHTEVNTELHTKSEYAPAQAEPSPLKAEAQKSSPGRPAGGASWADRPNTNTPAAMVADLRAFYSKHPEDLRLLLDTAKATHTTAELSGIIAAFCAYRIDHGRTTDTYQRHHAALQKWLIDEKTMRRPAAAPATQTGRVTAKPARF